MSTKLNRKEIEDANNKLESRINSSREEWNKKIIPLIEMIRDINKVVEAQVLMLSYRHMITDKIAELRLLTFRLNNKYDFYYKKEYRSYKLEYDIKLNAGESNQFVLKDLSPLKRQIDILNSHCEYYLNVIKTLDNLGFAIKRKLEMATENF